MPKKGGERVKKSLENGQADGVSTNPHFFKKATDAEIRDHKTHQTRRGAIRLHSREANPLKRSQHTGLKTARLQQGQNRAHFTSELGEAIRGVFRARNPIRILELPFLQGLLNAQKMTR